MTDSKEDLMIGKSNDIKNMRYAKRRYGTVNHSIDLKRSLNNSTLEPITSSYMATLDPFGDKS